MRRLLAVLVASIPAVAAFASCLEPTEIRVEVRTDLPCSDPAPRVDWTRVAVGLPGAVDGTSPQIDTRSCRPDGKLSYIGTFVMVPSGRGERVELRVAQHARTPQMSSSDCTGSMIASDCIVARRVVQYLHHSRLTLEINLAKACLGKNCPDGFTCEQGSCVPSDCTINPALCAEHDAGTDMDAGAPSIPPITGLVAGGNGTCSIHADKSVRCWGDNSLGQLAFATPMVLEAPTVIPKLQGFEHISLSSGFGCAVAPNGDVSCFGSDANVGRLGRGGGPEGYAPVPVVLPNSMTGTLVIGAPPLVATGERHACANGEGGLYCWGDNGSFQVSGQAGGHIDVAMLIAGSGWDSLAAGYSHTCATQGKVVYCWGSNALGACGTTGQFVKTPTPIAAQPNDTLLELSAGTNFTCARADAHVYCWGADSYLELGVSSDGGMPFLKDPVLIDFSQWSSLTSIGSGAQHTCVHSNKGAHICWGLSSEGQCGVVMSKGGVTPTRVTLPTGSLVAVGARHVCVAEPTTLDVHCFGANDLGQLGLGMKGAPVPAENAQKVVFTQ